MLEAVLITGVTLVIVLYGQARHAAREIRRNRTNSYQYRSESLLILSQDS
ncbi:MULTISPECIES: hypothetical protein [Parasedimentitalea]|nr:MULTISPECIES: hypothetical protein [Zongyanglinia]